MVTSRTDAATSIERARANERHLHDIARVIPRFGGYHIDSARTLVGYVTDLRHAESLRSRLNDIAADWRTRGVVDLSGVVVREARYDFRSLAAWRELASTQLHTLPGIVGSGIDFRRNQVVIGVDMERYPNARSESMRLLSRHGVPESAVHFVNSRPQ